MLLLDNSGSMKKTDPGFVTKEAVEWFVKKTSGDARMAIMVFDENANLAAPLTPISDETRDPLLASLAQVNYRGLFTNTPDAVERAVYELKVNGREKAAKSIILLTDGIIDTGDKARDLDSTRWLRGELADAAARNGIRIYGLALADQADFKLLHSLAQTTGGDYFRAYVADDMPSAFESIHEAIERHALPAIPPVVSVPEPAPEKQEPAPEEQAPAKPEPIPAMPASEAPTPTPTPVRPALKPPETKAPEQPSVAPSAALHDLGRVLTNPWFLVISAAVLLLGVLIAWLLARGKKQSRRPARLVAETMPSLEPMPQAFLYDRSGHSGTERHELTGRLTVVGRMAPEAEERLQSLVIDNATIGRRHAVIEYKNHGFWVIDQKSLNGTFVNDKRVTDEVCLKHGDRVRFHKIEFEFAMPGMEAAEETQLGDQGLLADKPVFGGPVGATTPNANQSIPSIAWPEEQEPELVTPHEEPIDERIEEGFSGEGPGTSEVASGEEDQPTAIIEQGSEPEPSAAEENEKVASETESPGSDEEDEEATTVLFGEGRLDKPPPGHRSSRS